MKWLFFLFAASAFATVNEPLRCEFFSGYRNDYLHWRATPYSEIDRDVEFWENGLAFKVIHRDLTFFLRGAYGAFGRGVAKTPVLRTPATGWNADAEGYFGYAINLTPQRTYQVILTPLVGYSAYFEELKRNALPGVLRLVWNGFFLGGGFLIEPGGRLIFNAGYTYHFIHNRFHTATIRTSSGGKGHTGWLQMDCVLNPRWRCGVGGQIHYFFTGATNASVKGSASEPFKLRWTSLSGWAQISREF